MLKTIFLGFIVTIAALPQIPTKRKWEHLLLLVRSDEEAILNETNLTAIKQFILRTGQRQTYCNMYNNNPYYKTKHFDFHLNPDNGQSNINCDTTKSDFNIISLKELRIDFRQSLDIQIRVPYADPSLPISHYREIAEKAVQELLSQIPAPPSAP